VFETINSLVPSILEGNSILLKDSTVSPVFAHHFEEATKDIAPGLIQKFFIDPMQVQELYQARAIDYLSFSGSYRSAMDVYHDLGKNDFIDFDLDLGGLNVAYIDESCSENEKLMDLAVEECIWGAFYNCGQSKNLLERILVHKSVSTTFINKMTERVVELFTLENPRNESCKIGCIQSLE